jgi:hypothetical protein
MLRGTKLQIALLVCLVGLGTTMAAAQSSAQCSEEKARQFDFRIGEWNVSAGGKQAGTNSIRPILDGCVLQETWSGNSGSAGSSFNFYNPADGRWEQFWVRRNGTTLHLTGGYADGKVVLQGESRDGEGAAVLNRITWHDNGDGTVRQHWETSRADGDSWSTAFDGLYSKQKAARP